MLILFYQNLLHRFIFLSEPLQRFFSFINVCESFFGVFSFEQAFLIEELVGFVEVTLKNSLSQEFPCWKAHFDSLGKLSSKPLQAEAAREM